jgi:hypothetical protein
MTIGTQTIIAERLTRSAGANTVTSDSDITKSYINEGTREFAQRVHGIALNAFIDLNPTFDIDTKAAACFSIKGNTLSCTGDVPIVSSTLRDATPTTVAGHLASNLNATFATTSFSVGWSASTWTFILNTQSTVTSIAVTNPSGIGYYSAVDALFGGAISKASTSITGGFPQNCTLESSLPSGFLEINYCMYDTWELTPAPFDLFVNPQATGTPSYYSVKNKKIRLYPTPITQGRFEIYYNGFPTDLGVDGSSDSVSCPLPEETHYAPVHWAAAKLFDEAHEFDKSIYHQRAFNDIATRYIIREANNNPSVFPLRPRIIPPKVVS